MKPIFKGSGGLHSSTREKGISGSGSTGQGMMCVCARARVRACVCVRVCGVRVCVHHSASALSSWSALGCCHHVPRWDNLHAIQNQQLFSFQHER